MPVTKPILLLAAAYLLPSATAAGAYDIDAAVAHALAHNPLLHGSREQVEAARERQQSADAAAMPVVTLSHTARVSDDPLDAFADRLFTRQVTAQDFDSARLNDPASTDLYATRLQVNWPVYRGGAVAARQREADSGLQQGRNNYQRAREQTAFATMQAYLYAIAADAALDIAGDAVAAAQQHADTTARLARAGRIVESDRLAAAVNLAAIKSQREQANTRVKLAYNRLRLQMGMQTDSQLAIAADWPRPAAAVDAAGADVAALQEEALAGRADLAAARSAIAAAEANVDATAAVNRPNLDLVASNSWYDDSPGLDSRSASLMAVASIKLYDGTTDGAIGAARASYKESQWQLQALELAVEVEVQQAYDELLEADARLALARENVAMAEAAVDQVEERYGQGRTILLDLLQSERAYTSARMELLTAELNTRTSRLALRFAAGSLELPAGDKP